MARVIKKAGDHASTSHRLTLHGNHAGRQAEAIHGQIRRNDEKPGFLRKSNAPGRRP